MEKTCIASGLHCLGPAKPWAGGCAAVPENRMKLIMKSFGKTVLWLLTPWKPGRFFVMKNRQTKAKGAEEDEISGNAL